MFLRVCNVLLTILFYTVLGVSDNKKNYRSADMEGFIIQGKQADITKFPHAAFLAIECHKHHKSEVFGCGSSVVNQVILLTAAHCLEGCSTSSQVSIVVGSAKRNVRAIHKSHSFQIHPSYDPTDVSNDIALIRTKSSIKFSRRTKRVSLTRTPPEGLLAYVSGWGMIDEELDTPSVLLKVASQKIMTIRYCKKKLTHLPRNTFCTESGKVIPGYPAGGDSGSALIVRGYIQIGIVSYKIPSLAKQLVVYTNVSHFYDWIRKISKKLYCAKP